MYCSFRMAQLFVAGCIAAALLLTLSGCTSKPNSSTSTATAAAAAAVTTVAPQNDFDGGTYCVQTFLQGPGPAQPLHFSNKITVSDPSAKSKDFEADLSGDSIQLVHHDRWLATEDDRKFFEESSRFADPKIIQRVINNGFAEETVTNHPTRSDEVGWRSVTTSIAQGGTPWSLFLYKPPVSRVGTENVNGFDTLKYTVDTTHQSAPEKSASLLRNVADYNITGTAWVLKDRNCVLQYDITDQEMGKDGKGRTTHYEGSVTKK